MGFGVANSEEWNVHKIVSPIDDSVTLALSIKQDGSSIYFDIMCRDGYGFASVKWIDSYRNFNDGDIIPIIYRMNTSEAVYTDVKVIEISGIPRMVYVNLPIQNIRQLLRSYNSQDTFSNLFANSEDKFYFQTNINRNMDEKLSITYGNINDPDIQQSCGL